jgi:hypothetical protein
MLVRIAQTEIRGPVLSRTSTNPPNIVPPAPDGPDDPSPNGVDDLSPWQLGFISQCTRFDDIAGCSLMEGSQS